MKVLLLSCSTGEGHNHCAGAVREALAARGHETEFLDLLQMFGEPGPLSFDKILNRISTKAPELFGMMYHAGAMYSATASRRRSIWRTSGMQGSCASSFSRAGTMRSSARTCSRWRR